MNRVTALLLFSLPIFGQSQNIDLWGVSVSGGDHNGGAIYQINSSGNTLNVEHPFFQYDGSFKLTWNNGICKASNGVIYGTSYGGASSGGILFEYNYTTNKYKKLIDFGDRNNIRQPGRLIEGKNNKLYGMSISGGNNMKGTLFEYDYNNDSVKILVHFDDSVKCSSTSNQLIFDGNTKLYGISQRIIYDGLYIASIIVNLFEYDISLDTYKIIHTFTEKDVSSTCGLYYSHQGKIYGTFAGGIGNDFLFCFDLKNNTYQNFYTFNATGKCPCSGLVDGPDSMLYGITREGGLYGSGTIYCVDTTINSIVKVIDLEQQIGGANMFRLLPASNSKLYGVSFFGGNKENGTLFEYDPILDTVKLKYSFDDNEIGYRPKTSLLEGVNGTLYGVTANSNSDGVLFSYNFLNDSINKIFRFGDGDENGSIPNGSLMCASDGKFYGVASKGGDSSLGVLYSYDKINNTYTKHLDFYNEIGSVPKGKPVEGLNGKLYGTTKKGGKNGYGTLYEYDIYNDSFSVLASFTKSTGYINNNDLILGYDGSLYGTSRYGGKQQKGVIYEYNFPDKKINIRYHFADGDGSLPDAGIYQGINGKIYGITGPRYLYEFDPTIGSYKIIKAFSWIYDYPISGLIEATNRKMYLLVSIRSEGKIAMTEFDPVTGSCIMKNKFDTTLIKKTYFLSFSKASNGNLYSRLYYPYPKNEYTLIEYDPLKDTIEYSKTIINEDNFDPEFKFTEYRNSCVTSFSTLDTNICKPFICPGGAVLSDTGTYYDVTQNYKGCDSIIKIKIGFLPKNITSKKDSACRFYVSPTGKVWKYSSHYQDTLTDYRGCDSIIHFDLNITHINRHVYVNGSTLTASYDSTRSYQWLDCNNGYAKIPGATDTSYTAPQSGSYAVQITQNGCIDTSDCYNISSGGLIAGKEIKIYPNPTNNQLAIDLGEQVENLFLTIVTSQGMVVNEFTYHNSSKVVVNIEGPKGIYYARIIKNNSDPVFIKVIKH